MHSLESLDNSKFAKMSTEVMRSTRGGTTTAGYDYTINGVTKTCASDCTEQTGDGRIYAEFYDAKGNLMDTHVW